MNQRPNYFTKSLSKMAASLLTVIRVLKIITRHRNYVRIRSPKFPVSSLVELVDVGVSRWSKIFALLNPCIEIEHSFGLYHVI